MNNVNLQNATHGDAAMALKNATSAVTLILQYRPEGMTENVLFVELCISFIDYQRFETKIDQLRNEIINQGGAPAPLPRRELYMR